MTDLVYSSRRRWGSSFDRAQQMVARFARARRVFVVEEPVRDGAGARPLIEVTRGADGLFVCTPHLPGDLDDVRAHAATTSLLDELVGEHRIDPQVLWVSSASALRGARKWRAKLVVWDCERVLGAASRVSSPARELERDLLARADLVLTSTYAARDAARRHHADVHCVPSGVDTDHFASGGRDLGEPTDQSRIPGPRLGICADIDDRIDLPLIARITDARPELQLVVIGGTSGLEPSALPFRPNLHWLGEKRMQDLPRYLAQWDVAMLPLVVPEARPFEARGAFELLASGLPLVATPAREVAAMLDGRPHVRLAERDAFVAAIDDALREPASQRRESLEALRADLTWDAAFARVEALVDRALERARAGHDAELDARTTA